MPFYSPDQLFSGILSSSAQSVGKYNKGLIVDEIVSVKWLKPVVSGIQNASQTDIICPPGNR